MPEETAYIPTPRETAALYYLKHAGSRLGLAAAQAFYILGQAWPQDRQAWVLFWLLMAANLAGVAVSVQGAGRVVDK